MDAPTHTDAGLPRLELVGRSAFWDELEEPWRDFLLRRIAAGDRIFLEADGSLLLMDP
jgi:hypothetical protein